MKTRKLTAALMTIVMVFSMIISPMGSAGVRAEGTEDGWYGEVMQLQSGTVSYPPGANKSLQITNEAQKGIYFLNGSEFQMKVGETQQLEVSSGGAVEEEYIWKSSDPKILSVTNDGEVFGWHEGTATVTVSNGIGLTDSFTITVVPRTETETYQNSLMLTGDLSLNVSANDYSGWNEFGWTKNWSSPLYSYLIEDEDGILTRVEYMYAEEFILVEQYDEKTGELKKKKTMSLELPLFGGFYSGAEYNYLVFGQVNGDENGNGSDDETEVVRIVKYTKDWERLDAVPVYGANTYIPFEAGSLRMTETAGRLYIHTCHEMYKNPDDGKNHQANMTFVVNESTMEIEDSFYNVLNLSQAGYVSHSFNQFIQTDGDFIYRVDHGDAYPRAVSLTRCAAGGSIRNVSYSLPYEIIGGKVGDNYTGVSVGGFELSSDTCLIAGNSVKQDGTNAEYYGQQNIFLTVTDKALNDTDILWLTDYTDDSSVEVRTPQLVKLGKDQFLLMWEEKNTDSGSIGTRMVTIDGYGNCTSDVITTDMRLSDCQPIVGAGGLVRWYQSDGEVLTLYTIDPLELSSYGDDEMPDDDEKEQPDDEDLPKGTVELPAGTINYSSQYRECRQIPNETQKGIYFLNDSELIFYSFATGESEKVYTFENGVVDSYAAGGKLYTIYNRYTVGNSGGGIVVYDLDTGDFEKTILLDFYPGAIGVDEQGRIYLSHSSYDSETNTSQYRIYLLDAEGQVLSQAAAPSQVYDFGGFDSVTGNFYFECYYNWVYWGYDHDMVALGVGNVSGDDSIEVYDHVLQTISQKYYSDRQRSMELVGDKYLCVDTPVYATGSLMSPASSGLFILDSHENDISVPTFSLKAVLGRSYVESAQYPGRESVGPRCAYNEENDSIIAYYNDSMLVEYSMEMEDFIGVYRTVHPVFSLETYGDYIVAIERDNDGFYLELIQWKHADKLEIVSDSSNMKAGETMQLEVVANGTIEDEYTWETSDSKIVSVTNGGKVFGWREGIATVTVTNSDGVKASITITVVPRAETGETYPVSLTLSGTQSAYANISRNNYSVWSSTMNSYLVDNEDGTLTRVENMGTYVLVEIYDKKTGELKDSKKLSIEISEDAFFGGFYSGAEYNYLVFGQVNGDENGNGSDDETEVVRIVKYSKDWEWLDEASVYGANTYIPFDAGSLRMTETAGRLYVYTCHEMYKSDDGLNHQANMTFVVKEDTMEIVDSYFGVMNIAQAGYVSHSFNQFIQTDGTFIYRVDHGDASPRAVSITRCVAGGSVERVSYTLPYKISGAIGYNYNYTGVSVGGFELSSDSCLIVGNSVKQDGNNTNVFGQRNIFLTITDKVFNNTEVRWFTNYTDGSIEVRTPQLVKLGEDQFLLMWEERNANSGSIVTRMVTLDGYGNRTSNINDFDMRLSDCQPVVGSDGMVRWYTTDGSMVVLYTIDPLALKATPKLKGDVDRDGFVTTDDASYILQYVVGALSLDEEQLRLANVDGDKEVSTDDAAMILGYVVGRINQF